MRNAEFSQLYQEANQLCEQLTWLQGQPKQVKRLAWEGRLSVQQASTLLAECVQLATSIEVQLNKIVEYLDTAGSARANEPDQPPLRLVRRLNRAPAYRRSCLG